MPSAEVSTRTVSIAGREGELAALGRLFEVAGPRALVLEGEPGIGKTLLWEEGVRLADERGCRLLATRPAQAERGLSYLGLADLLAGSLDVLDSLAGPRRRALEVALSLADP